jgi:hypothetical protein
MSLLLVLLGGISRPNIVNFSDYTNGTTLYAIDSKWVGTGATAQVVTSGTLSDSTLWTGSAAVYVNGQGSNQTSKIVFPAGMLDPGSGWTSGPIILVRVLQDIP